MAHPRRFRFGVQLNQPYEGSSWTESARELESLGYSTLFVPDHVDSGYAPLAAMAAAAAATTTLRVAPLVLASDFRHPAMVGRELTTIDQLSGGRLEVGLGAGWKRVDYTQTGIPMDRPGVRVDRMIEHAQVLKALFAGSPVHHDGEHYDITGLVGSPAPHAPDGPPFIIGGGAPRVLRFAGEFADIVGVNPSIHSGEIDGDAARDAQADRIDQKVEWVREGAGDRFDDLELNAWVAAARFTDDPVGFADEVAPLFGAGSGEELLSSPMTLVGNVDSLTQELNRRRDRWGYSYVVVPGDEARVFAPLVAALTGT
ncbi:MAG: TIGR03621 family F420-dependent LLM class oxidoreductase [Acidimicrobiales bacterium]|nr:TIGR03621 family F420-dependent LLM class oxidoreductase [Acidimicrobiales bacterium]